MFDLLLFVLLIITLRATLSADCVNCLWIPPSLYFRVFLLYFSGAAGGIE